VSPTIGETSCKKQIQKQYDFLNQFERIIVGFDNDEPGRRATEDIIEVLPRGKVWIANWRYKDPNDYLVSGKQREFVSDFYAADKHTPAGVVASDKIFEEVLKFQARVVANKCVVEMKRKRK
jgi:DNA primase